MASLLRVVLDTNVWISGMFFGRGAPAKLLQCWRDEQFNVVMSLVTLAELETVLSRKSVQFGAEPNLALEWLKYVEAYAAFVDVETSFKGSSRDPKDDMMLEAAVAGAAEYLVTGDQDLLVLRMFRNTRIITPREFLDLLGGTSQLIQAS